MGWELYTTAYDFDSTATSVGIYGLDDGLAWAENNVSVDPATILTLVTRLQNPLCGAKINYDQSYVATGCTPEPCLVGTKQGLGTICVLQTKRAIVVGFAGDGINGRNTLSSLYKLKADLEKKGF